jgi:hypothetical protein
MKLNLSILAYELSDLSPQLTGSITQALFLSDIRLMRKDLRYSPEFVYFVETRQLFDSSWIPHAMVCIDGTDVVTLLKEKQTQSLIINYSGDPMELFERIQDIFFHYNMLDGKLRNAIEQNMDLDSIVNICADFFHNPVYIIDAALSLITMSNNYELAPNDISALELKASGHTSTSVVRELNRKGLTSILNVSTKSIYVKSHDTCAPHISASFIDHEKGARFASLSVCEASTPLSPLQAGVADHIVSLLSHRVYNHCNNNYFNRTQVGVMFEKILKGKFVNMEIISKTLSRIKWNINDDYLLICINVPSSAFSKGTAMYAKKVYETLFANSVVLEIGEYFVIIYHGVLDSENFSTTDLLEQKLVDTDAKGIIGLSFRDITQLKNQWRLISSAIEFDPFPRNGNRLIRYETILFNHFINECAQIIPLNAICHQGVVQLYEYEKENHGELLNSLRIYLEEERSLISAAKRLHVHRNTLVYRLNRIADMTQLPFNDANSRLHMLLSCYCLRYLDEKSGNI